jgi:hypothetical protein
MTDIILQVALTLSLVLSVVLGESLSTRVFGVLKNSWLYLLDILLFVVLVVVALNNIGVENPVIALPLYFLSGFLIIISVRGLTTLLGFESAKSIRREEKRVEANEEHYIENLIRNLKRYDLKTDEIEEVLLNSGFKKKLVEKKFRNR